MRSLSALVSLEQLESMELTIYTTKEMNTDISTAKNIITRKVTPMFTMKVTHTFTGKVTSTTATNNSLKDSTQ